MYKVEITETLQLTTEIEASSSDEALSIAKELYDTGEIELDYDDYVSVDYQLADDKKEL
jgi:hypothetical protein